MYVSKANDNKTTWFAITPSCRVAGYNIPLKSLIIYVHFIHFLQDATVVIVTIVLKKRLNVLSCQSESINWNFFGMQWMFVHDIWGFFYLNLIIWFINKIIEAEVRWLFYFILTYIVMFVCVSSFHVFVLNLPIIWL